MSTLKVVRITPENYGIYDGLVHRRLHGQDSTGRGLPDSSAMAHVRDELSRKEFYVFVAELDSEPVGWIHAVYIPKIGRWQQGYLYVDELWVDPAYRKQGIGKALCEHINKLMSETNACKIRLYTDNPVAQRLYEKCGWKTTNYCVFLESEQKATR